MISQKTYKDDEQEIILDGNERSSITTVKFYTFRVNLNSSALYSSKKINNNKK